MEIGEKIGGVVLWFCTKGYGKVKGEDSQEYFIHYKDIKMDGWKTLEEGQTVRFTPMSAPRGPKAMDLELS